jgi:hypothetical protein
VARGFAYKPSGKFAAWQPHRAHLPRLGKTWLTRRRASASKARPVVAPRLDPFSLPSLSNIPYLVERHPKELKNHLPTIVALVQKELLTPIEPLGTVELWLESALKATLRERGVELNSPSIPITASIEPSSSDTLHFRWVNHNCFHISLSRLAQQTTMLKRVIFENSFDPSRTWCVGEMVFVVLVEGLSTCFFPIAHWFTPFAAIEHFERFIYGDREEAIAEIVSELEAEGLRGDDLQAALLERRDNPDWINGQFALFKKYPEYTLSHARSFLGVCEVEAQKHVAANLLELCEIITECQTLQQELIEFNMNEVYSENGQLMPSLLLTMCEGDVTGEAFDAHEHDVMQTDIAPYFTCGLKSEADLSALTAFLKVAPRMLALHHRALEILGGL